ncbi:DUF2752 domain-containing protein [Enemella sp. A6]|uniref:DUF2752 domain-containing protein n=1 Tax=Enemella sp. A6 TaxID=3440152 RepID=UPI003EB804A5
MTSSTVTARRPVKGGAVAARRRVLGVSAFAAGGLVFTLAYHQMGVGVPCPMLALTGWWCPFCGATRMASSVLDGDFAGAFYWNPAVFIALLVLGAATTGWVAEWATGKAPPWRTLVQRRPFGWWFTLAMVVMVVWVISRNIGRILVGG